MAEILRDIPERLMPENTMLIPKPRYALFDNCAYTLDGKERVGTIWDMWFSWVRWEWNYQVSRKNGPVLGEKDLRIITLAEKKAIRART